MAASEVRIEYDEVRAIRALAEEQRERITQLLQRINDQIDTLKSDNWVGDNADAFYNEMGGDAVPGMDRLIRAVAALEDSCNQIITIFEAGEDEAQACFPKA